jgi:plastocyanin
MTQTRVGVLLMRVAILVTVGCVSHPPFPESSLTGGLFEVLIGESLTPKVVTAKQGDEVRWVNTTSGPVDISFVQSQDDLISCQKGFVSTGWGYLFGSMKHESLVVATVHTNDSASLCFAIPGTYAYTVRTKTATTGQATSIAGSITIE